MHVLCGALNHMMDSQEPYRVPDIIEKATVDMAIKLVEYFQDQRHVYEKVNASICFSSVAASSMITKY